MKIQTKTTILFTVLTATIFLILNIAVYFFIKSFVNNDFEKRLELRTKLYTKFTFDQGDEHTEAFRILQKQYLEQLPQEEGYILKADTINEKKDGKLPGKLPYSFIRSIENAEGGTAFYENHFRHYAGILYKNEAGSYVVIKSATNEYGSNVMRQLRIINVLVLLGAVALIVSIGFYFSKKTFKPIRSIINRANQISEANLHLRLKELSGSDELTELTNTFNQMLMRLETAFETQNNFISNASHELRTPLTVITGEADLALSAARTPAEYQESLQKIMQQSETLKELTKGLLALAQTGFDGTKQPRENIRADELLYNVKENCDAILPGNQIRIHMEHIPEDAGETTIRGNNDMLKIALSNIIMNGCKYSDNGPVDVDLDFNNNKVIITVTDSGIGIPENELKNIYDPFFRASNVKGYDGFGIGMPLSNNIIRLHKGKITVRSAVNSGTTVTVILPAAA